MGGTGSGRTTSRPHTGEAMPLDFRPLFRAGVHRRAATARLAWRNGDGAAAAVSVTADPDTPGQLRVAYRIAGQDVAVPVRIVATATRGAASGLRPWACCPGCGARAAVLWLWSGQVRCRACHDLRYASQREAERDRAVRALRRARRAIGPDAPDECLGCVWDWLPPRRPATMRRPTYARLVARLRAAQDRCERSFALDLEALAERVERMTRDVAA